MLQQVARLASQSLCEFCIIDMLDERSVARVAIAHADASLLDRLQAEAESFVPSPGGRIERMLAGGEPDLEPAISQRRTSSWPSKERGGAREKLRSKRAPRPAPKDLDFWDSFVPTSYLAVPIKVGGEIAAIMTLAASRTPLRFDADRLAFACEVAAWCGLALEVVRDGAVRPSRTRTIPPALRAHTEPPVSIRRRTGAAG